ncbi:ras-responsive element-binding protein 1-like isoform X2 [Tachypleus tridentatus]|uniref:ras-responsive element-binding protein 1-like isoform X2 n=1 Tax=Tachypleus tridentatus TaxID=6853 RepID=UPI003FD428F3
MNCFPRISAEDKGAVHRACRPCDIASTSSNLSNRSCGESIRETPSICGIYSPQTLHGYAYQYRPLGGEIANDMKQSGTLNRENISEKELSKVDNPTLSDKEAIEEVKPVDDNEEDRLIDKKRTITKKNTTASESREEPTEESDQNFSSVDKGENNILTIQEPERSNEKAAIEVSSTQVGPFSCPLCEKLLNSAHSFTVHIRQHNPNDQSRTCRLCGKTLSSTSSLDRHMLVHSGERPFKCKICNMAFTTNGNMHRHMRTHGISDENQEGVKIAKESKSKPTSKRKLCSEQNSHVSDSVMKKLSVGSETVNTVNNSSYGVPVFEEDLSKKCQFQSHMDKQLHDPHTSSEGGVTISPSKQSYCITQEKKKELESQNTLAQPSVGFRDVTFVDFSLDKFSLIAKTYCEQNKRRPSSAFHNFQCPKCNKGFPCGSALRLHKINHNEKMTTYCPSCRCDFESPLSLQSHQLKHKAIERCFEEVHADKDCIETLNSESNHLGPKKQDFLALLELQTKGSEVALKPVNRETREGIFENPSYFIYGKPKEEVRKGMATEPTGDFADIQSILSVTSKSPLLSSVRSSPVAASPASPPQPTTSVSPESPLVADTAAVSPSSPSKTEQSNTKNKPSNDHNSEPSGQLNEMGEFPCDYCNFSFKSASALKRHKRCHSQGCTTYSCSLCTYTSLDKSTLIRHLRTHNGERPFQCGICKYAFTTKANCERHVRKRHKKVNKIEIRSAMQYNPNMAELKSPKEINTKVSVCKYCNVDFKFNRVLRHHLRSLQNSCSRKPFCCNICHLGFSTKNNCIRHVMKQHPDMREKLSEVVSANVTSDISDQESLILSDESPHKDDRSKSSFGSQSENLTDTNQPLNLALQIEHISRTSSRTGSVDLSSIDDIVSAANSLVILSTMPPPQEEPLNLAVHALDLSLKTSNKSELYKIAKPASIFSMPGYFPTSFASNSQQFHVSPPLFSGSKLSTTNKFHGLPRISGSPYMNISFSTNISPRPRTLKQNDDVYMNFKMVNDKLAPRNQRSFICPYCSAGFTLKSNMERHIKRKHPEYARPTRSRNFIPNLTPSVQKPSAPALSSKTRAALRDLVLGNKAQENDQTEDTICVNENKSVELDYQQQGLNLTLAEESERSTSFETGDINSEVDKIRGNNSTLSSSESNKKITSDSEGAADLASVSSVIDTANSQAFRQYLMDAKTDDRKPSSSSEITEKVQPEIKECKISAEDSTQSVNNALSKKKSYYNDSPNSVSCPFCSRKFPWTSSLRRHILTHTGQKPFKCPRCPIWFTTKSNCERHLLRKHGRNSEIHSRSVPERPFKCNICPSSTFSTPGNLRKHYYLKHWTKKGGILGPRYSDSELNNHEHYEDHSNALEVCENEQKDSFNQSALDTEGDCSGSDSKQHKPLNDMHCQCCDRTFLSRKELDAHTGQHLDLPYKCHLCDNSYGKRQECLDHLQLIHNSEYQLLINKGALDQQGLEKEAMLPSPIDMNIINNNNEEDENDSRSKQLGYIQRKVICAFCLRRFWSTEDLRRHMRTHSGERPFACDICHRKFSLKHSMTRHRRKHQGHATLAFQDSTDEDCPPMKFSLRSKSKSRKNQVKTRYCICYLVRKV